MPIPPRMNRSPWLSAWVGWPRTDGPPDPEPDSTPRSPWPPWPELLLALIVTTLVGTLLFPTLDERIALRGYSALDLIAHLEHPENFARDWPNGMSAFGASGVLSLFLFLHQWIPIDPLFQMKIHLAVELFGFTLALGLISKRLFNHLPTTLLLTGVVLLAPMAGKNFGNLGQIGFLIGSHYLKYGLALTVGLWTLLFFLHRALLPAFIGLCLTFLLNANIGLWFGGFTLAHTLILPDERRNPRILLGLLGFGTVILAWWYWVQSHHPVVGAAIPVDQWIHTIRIFSFHNFSTDLGYYTTQADRFLLPIALVALLYGIVLAPPGRSPRDTLLIQSGILAGLLLTLLSVILGEWLAIPFFNRMQLTRASALSSLFGLFFLVRYLTQRLLHGGVIPSWAAGYSLGALCLADPGLSLRSLGLLLWLDLCQGRLGSRRLTRSWQIGAALAFGTLLAALFFPDLLLPPHTFEGRYFLLEGGHFRFGDQDQYRLLILTAAVALLLPLGRWLMPRRLLAGSASLLLLGLWAGNLQRQLVTPGVSSFDPAVAKSYLQAQNWAREHTPTSALIMVDPSRELGWRDFAHRSSFGSLREWLYLNITYENNLALFEQGQERARLFGIDLWQLDIPTCRSTRSLCGERLVEQVRERYYALSGEELAALRTRYGIDYFLFWKVNRPTPPHPGTTVFANDHFLIWQPATGAPP